VKIFVVVLKFTNSTANVSAHIIVSLIKTHVAALVKTTFIQATDANRLLQNTVEQAKGEYCHPQTFTVITTK